ncbi:MAG: phosphatase PAP2 family protein [Pseudorhizobium sp.]
MRYFIRANYGAGREDILALLPFHILVAAYSLLVTCIALWLDKAAAISHGAYFSRLGPLYLITLPVAASVVSLCLVVHRTGTWKHRRQIMQDYLSAGGAGRAVAGLLVLVSFIVLMGSFTTFKNLMPHFYDGFPYDQIQADADWLLHFGHDPGPTLVRLLPYPLLRQAVEWNYSILWSLFGFLPVFFIAVYSKAEVVRLRYLTTLAASWIVVGSILACLFLSAGPAFYGSVTGDRLRFAAVGEFLQQGQALSSAAAFQAYLWANYEAGTSALASGISAFPSMHVALAMLNALFLRELSRPAGYAGFAYVAFILFGSVYLGWHYAIDGYVSIVTVLLLHAGIRRLFQGRSETQSRWSPARPTDVSPPIR